MEEMRRYMLEQAEAGGTRELYTLARGLNRLYHYNDPRWQVIPPELAATGNLIFVYEASAPISGVILEYTDLVYKNGQFVVFYKDTRGDTVREAIARAKKFIAEHPLQGVQMRLAGGFIGTTAALNEEIAASERQATLLVILTVYFLVWGSYGSFVAANMVMVALIAAGVASYMYISFMGIGMNINSLPVTAVGMGIGVDYIFYVVDRIRREVPVEGSMIHGDKTGDLDDWNGGDLYGDHDDRRYYSLVLHVESAIFGGDGLTACHFVGDSLVVGVVTHASAVCDHQAKICTG